METKAKNASLWTGTFFMLILMNLCNGAAGQMTMPLVTKFALSLNPDLTLASTIAGLMSIMSLVVCPVAGYVADRVNRRKLLLFSLVGYGMSLALHALATRIWILVAARLLTGIFFSLVSVIQVAYSSSFIPKERFGEGMGYISLAMILAQAVGPAIGLTLVKAVGYQIAFATAALAGFGGAVVVFCLPDKEGLREKGPKKSLALKDLFAVEFTGYMLLAALFSSGNGLITAYLAILADERSIENIALFFTVYSACMVVLRPFTGKLLDRKGVYVILIPSVIAASLGMVFVGVGYSLTMMVIASVFKAIGQGSGTPTLQAHCVKRLDKSRSGVATSTIMIGQNVGNAVAPIVGSFFVKAFGYEVMFCGYGGILLVCGLLLLLWQYRAEKRA